MSVADLQAVTNLLNIDLGKTPDHANKTNAAIDTIAETISGIGPHVVTMNTYFGKKSKEQ